MNVCVNVHVCVCVCAFMCVCMCVRIFVRSCMRIYTTIAALYASIFMRIHFPIRDLWTAFCVLLSFVFYDFFLTMSHFARCDVYAAVFALDVATALRQINR